MGALRALTETGAVYGLGDGVSMVAVPFPGGQRDRQLDISVGGHPLPKPCYMAVLPLQNQGDVVVVVARFAPAQLANDITLNVAGHQWPAIRLGSPHPVADLYDLLCRLALPARLRLLRQLVDTVGVWFKLAQQNLFHELVVDLMTRLHEQSLPVTAAVDLGGGLVYLRGRGIDALAVQQVIVLAGGRYRRSSFLPRNKSGGSFEIVVEGIAEGETVDLVLFGDQASWQYRLTPAVRQPLMWLLGTLAHDADAIGTLDHLLPKAKPYLGSSNSPLASTVRRLVKAVRRPRKTVLLPYLGLAAGAELVLATPGGGVFVRGWAWDAERSVERFDVVTPFGQRAPLISPNRLERDDVRRKLGARMNGADPAACYGFAAFAANLGPELAQASYRLMAVLHVGGECELVPPAAPATPGQARDAVLQTLPLSLPAAQVDEVIAGALAQAVAVLHGAHLAGRRIAHAYTLGAPVTRPRWSLVVPLYRNLSFLRTQYAKFALDAHAAEMEVIYVLDSPEQDAVLRVQLEGLVLTYGLPVTVVVHERNLGYAPAINSGLRYACGRNLVLMNSDVIPLTVDWLGALSRGMKRHRAALVGPKLLFDDDSLQHAGLYYAPYLDGRWINRHYYKGYPRDFAPATVSRRVPGVTGACLMIDRTLFERIGGLCEDFVIGDYEDSDLCLRLWSQNLACAYIAEAELYHFERRSISKHQGYQETAAVHYNRWLHWQRWSAVIPEAMRGFSQPAAPLISALPLSALPQLLTVAS